MADLKLNAAKIIAAQQKRRSGARSPETDSNWDSSEPEDTLPNVSSDDDVGKVSSHSRRNETTHTPRAPQQDNKPNRTHVRAHKPVGSDRLNVNGTHQATKSSPVSSIRSGKVSKAGINVFIDHGSNNSSDEDVSVASRKSALRKEDRPPYDFRGALDEKVTGTFENGDEISNRPGRSRKGDVYDPPSDGLNQNARLDKNQLTANAADENTDRKKWKVNLGFQQDDVSTSGTAKDNNNIMSKLGKDVSMTTMTMDMEGSIRMSGGPTIGGDDVENYDVTDSRESRLVVEESTQRYVYHYLHGNTRYYDTRSSRQDVYMAAIADKSERLVRRGVLEFLAAVRIVVDALLIILLELLRFITYNILGLLFVGLLTTFGDYFFKPVLAAFFNSILQPLAVFLYNIGVALRMVFSPLIEILRALFVQIAMLLRALRLVEVNWRIGSTQNRGMEEV